MHNQYIPKINLNSQKFIEDINAWTKTNKMVLNQKKTKIMLFNFTDNYQFTTRLSLNDENLEVVKETKLLGVIISDNLKWDQNTDFLVKKRTSEWNFLEKYQNLQFQKKKRKTFMFYTSEASLSIHVWYGTAALLKIMLMILRECKNVL